MSARIESNVRGKSQNLIRFQGPEGVAGRVDANNFSPARWPRWHYPWQRSAAIFSAIFGPFVDPSSQANRGRWPIANGLLESVGERGDWGEQTANGGKN
jgi:hypothetical protein